MLLTVELLKNLHTRIYHANLLPVCKLWSTHLQAHFSLVIKVDVTFKINDAFGISAEFKQRFY